MIHLVTILILLAVGYITGWETGWKHGRRHERAVRDHDARQQERRNR